MMRSQTLLTLLAFLALTANVGATATDNLMGVARAPLGFEGTLSSSADPWLLAYDLPLKPSANLNAESVRLTVHESRYPVGVVFSPPSVAASRDLTGPRTPDVRTLKDFSATFVVATPGSEWHVVGTNQTGLHTTSRCGFTHAAAWDAEAVTTLRYTMPDVGRLVHASCDVRNISMEGPVHWRIWNTTLLLRYTDPATRAVRIEELATGDRFEPNPMVPGAFDRVIRSATIQSLTKRSVATWKGPAHADLESPAFAIRGALDVPLDSELTWDDRTYQNEPVTPAPEGVFRLTPSDGHVQLAGRTMNSPRAPDSFALDDVRLVAGSLAVGLLLFLGWALYARLNREDVLAHPARRAIVDHLQQNPGATLRELNRVAPGSRSALLHHIRRLRSNGFVAQRPVGRVMLYALRQDEPRLHEPEFLAQRMKRHELVCLIIAQEPAVSQSEIAQRIGVTQSYVSRILSDLIRDGRVERVGTGPRRSYRLVTRPDATPAERPFQGSSSVRGA